MRDFSKKTSLKFVLAGIFSISQAYMISCICGITQAWIILIAVCLVTLIIILLLVYSLKTKNEITIYQTFLVWIPCSLIIVVIIS